MKSFSALGAFLLIPLVNGCLSAGHADELSELAQETGHSLSRVRGWPVLLNNDWASSNPAVATAILAHLDNQLYRVERAVGSEHLEILRTVNIWVEGDDPHGLLGGMCYHPNADWLKSHGYDPRRALGVEISNPEEFLVVTRTQPWVVMHELAHAYHHQVLGFDNPELVALYESAVASGDYEETFRLRGHPDRHYALTNPMEYFAEGTEAYLGTNDYYPFVRGELMRHDPDLARYLAGVWEPSAR